MHPIITEQEILESGIKAMIAIVWGNDPNLDTLKMIQIFRRKANGSIFLEEGRCSQSICEKENDLNLLGETELERVDFDGSLAKVIFVASNNSSFKCSQFRKSKNQIIWKVGSFRIWNRWLWIIEKYVLHLYKIGGLLTNSLIVFVSSTHSSF